MLKKILVVSLAVLTLASCKKDKDDSPAYSLSAKIDGTSQAFNTAVAAQKAGDASTGYSLIVTGVGGSSSNPYPAFSIILDDNAAFVAKTYTATAFEAGCMYMADSQTNFTSDDDFSVTITSITDTNVAGTFSGKVDDGSGVIKNITEGAFSAKFQ